MPVMAKERLPDTARDVVSPRLERCKYTPGIGAVAQSVRAADS
jgi:hypothetical protein